MAAKFSTRKSKKEQEPEMARNTDSTLDVQGDTIVLQSGRRVMTKVEKPVRPAGQGRPRIPTEFDDMIMDWYQLYLDAEDKDEAWVGIRCENEEDRTKVHNDLRKAADLHSKGITRSPGEDADGLLVKVQVHEKLARGPRSKPVAENGNGEVAEAE